MSVKEVTENGITFNRTSREDSWRLVHDGYEIIMLDKITGVTETKHSVFMSVNFKDVINYMNDNNINYNSLLMGDQEKFKKEALKDLDVIDDADIIKIIDAHDVENWVLIYDSKGIISFGQEIKKTKKDDIIFTSRNYEDCIKKIEELGFEDPKMKMI